MYGKLLIRADADEQIGNGHIMRCLAIAQEWVGRGGGCLFIVERCPDELVSRIQSESCGVSFIGEQSVPGVLAEHAPDILLVDGFHYPTEYLEQMRSDSYLLATFDEFGRKQPFSADIIINPQPVASESDYQETAAKCLLLGLDYLPLRAEFASLTQGKSVLLAQRNRILVNFGGTDVKRLTLGLVEEIVDKLPPGVVLDVVLSETHPDYAAVRMLLECYPARLACHSNVRNMAELMCRAGMAISAAGSTIWELMAVGVPLIPVIVSDNQKVVSHYRYWPNVINAVGRENESVLAETIDTALDFWENPELRQEYAKQYEDLSLHHGAANIVTALHEVSRMRAVGQ